MPRIVPRALFKRAKQGHDSPYSLTCCLGSPLQDKRFQESHLTPVKPESSASANSATRATNIIKVSIAFAAGAFLLPLFIAPRKPQLCQLHGSNSRFPENDRNLFPNLEKRRPSPKVPHLPKYVISGNYFGKAKINCKIIPAKFAVCRLVNGATLTKRLSQ